MIATPIINQDDMVIQPQPQPVAERESVDAEFIELDLPSQYKLYDFKHLYIRPLKIKHIRKIIQGHKNKNTRYMAEVINSCITCELGYKDLVYRLTQEDFIYIQYWERLHSFPAMPLNHICECHNPKHIELVEQGKLPKSSLVFPQIISRSDLKVNKLELDDLTIDQQRFVSPAILTECPTFKIKYPLLGDYLDMLDLAEKQIGDDDEEGEAWFLTGLVATRCSVKHEDGTEWTIEEKFNFLDNLDIESFYRLREFEAQMPQYGVEELINVKCPRCGAVSKSRVQLTAHSFLPQYNTPGRTE